MDDVDVGMVRSDGTVGKGKGKKGEKKEPVVECGRNGLKLPPGHICIYQQVI